LVRKSRPFVEYQGLFAGEKRGSYSQLGGSLKDNLADLAVIQVPRVTVFLRTQSGGNPDGLAHH
jgi:hypothetical protein